MKKPSLVMLRLDSLRFEPPRAWWKEGDPLGRIFACARAADLWLDFDHVVKGSGRPKHFDSEQELAASIVAGAPARYTIQPGKSEEPDCHLTLDIKSLWLRLRFHVGGALLDSLRDTLLDRFISLSTRIHDDFHDTALLGPGLAVEIHEPDFPRIRPPREPGFWVYGDAVDFICRKFHEESPKGKPEDARRMLAAPMPAGTKRIEVGDLVIFRWVDTLRDGDHVAARRALQEQWLVNVLNPPISSGYNEAGDRLEVPLSAESKPPLTFYDSTFQAGYKATALAPDGSADEELFDELAQWISSRQLPDGTPLTQLNLILPNRDSALRVRERASAIGVNNVYYADNEGRWWNPFPPGLWRE